MPTRLIFVGNTGEGKLFYNADANPTEKNAIFIDSQETETPVDLVSFISSNPDMNEIRSTPFHKFLWDGAEGQMADRWKRVFMNRTQPVDESLIKDVEVKKKPKKRLVAQSKNNQIMAFKSLVFSQQFEKMPNSALGNRRSSNRTIMGMNSKILGPVRAGYDGDNDGFIDDGLPTMRPFIPGLDAANIRIPKSVRAQGMRVRTSSSPVDRFATISVDQIRQTIIKQDKFLEKRFNDGKPITSIGDIKRILMDELPSFASGGSHFDFLDGPDDQPLEPYAYENMVGFLLALHANPSMKKFSYDMKPFSIGDEPGVGGSTRYQSGHQWTVVNGAYVATKNRTPKITITYRHPMDPMYKMASPSTLFSEGRFDVSSNIIGSAMMSGMAESLGGSLDDEALMSVYELLNYNNMNNSLGNFIDLVTPQFGSNPDARLPGVDQETMDTIKYLMDAGVIPDNMFDNGATIRLIEKVRDVVKNQSSAISDGFTDQAKGALKYHEEMWSVLARSTAIHEATHAAHFAQMHEDMSAYLLQRGVDPSVGIPEIASMMTKSMDKKQLKKILDDATDMNAVVLNRIFSDVFRNLAYKASSTGNQNAQDTLEDFMSQPLYNKDGSVIKINKEIADLFNRLESMSGQSVFGDGYPYKEGDNFTFAQAHMLADGRILSLQRRDARRQFAGIKLYYDKDKTVASNALTLIRQEGYPALVMQRGKTQPLSKKSGELIADSVNSAMGMVGRIIHSGVDLRSVRAVGSFRHTPTDIAGPLLHSSQLNARTIQDMAAIDDVDGLKNIAEMSIINSFAPLAKNADPATLGTIMETTGMDFWHFDSLKDDDVKSIIDMARQSAEPGYRNYMSTALNRRIVSFLQSNPDSSELMAELAVYDAFGIPIQVHEDIDGRPTSKRALTSDEIKLFDKLLSWLFPKGKLSNISEAK